MQREFRIRCRVHRRGISSTCWINKCMTEWTNRKKCHVERKLWRSTRCLSDFALDNWLLHIPVCVSSDIYIVPITRAWLCSAPSTEPQALQGQRHGGAEPGALSYYLSYTKLRWEQRPSLNLDEVPGSLDYCRASLVLGTRPLLVTWNSAVSSFMVRCYGSNSLLFFNSCFIDF